MAATYYAQHLASFRWADMVRAVDGAFTAAREYINEHNTLPTDGLTHIGTPYPNIIVNVAEDDESDDLMASIYLGRMYRDSPSGSFYAPWTPMPADLRDKDARWWEALEKAAQRHGFALISGEGDPTDTYVYAYRPREES